MGEAARVQIPPAQRSAPQAVRHSTGKGLDLLTGTPSASRSLEKPDSENIPPSKHHHHHHQPRNSNPKPEPESKTRGEGDGRGCEKTERKLEQPEVKKEPLVKANGVPAGPEPALEPGSPYPEAPRVPTGGERAAQPNGWQYSSPSRPGSTAFPPQDGESIGHRRSFPPRTNPDKIAQRKSSMNQLQQWVNLRRGVPPPEDLRSWKRKDWPVGGLSAPDALVPEVHLKDPIQHGRQLLFRKRPPGVSEAPSAPDTLVLHGGCPWCPRRPLESPVPVRPGPPDGRGSRWTRRATLEGGGARDALGRFRAASMTAQTAL
ncbi:pleckstrin homology domain-containing family A member 6-like [Gracilinanus agilis]|uniref:pleckstrin homology domain-containing family A member 6-like n=1 Tax=Gracilinanus agilis TaxID=191870 RepID=UPI001CFDF414|nr:pleckstrin homology domain-containing family A member 6-like [Gracilinanus agilis]